MGLLDDDPKPIFSPSPGLVMRARSERTERENLDKLNNLGRKKRSDDYSDRQPGK